VIFLLAQGHSDRLYPEDFMHGEKVFLTVGDHTREGEMVE
jgi:hypothetical protein